MPLVCFDFAERRQAYAEACMNKSRPWMHCNGHCRLMQKLMKASDENDQNSNNAFKALTVDLCAPIASFRFGMNIHIESIHKTYKLPEVACLLVRHCSGILRPPRKLS